MIHQFSTKLDLSQKSISSNLLVQRFSILKDVIFNGDLQIFFTITECYYTLGFRQILSIKIILKL